MNQNKNEDISSHTEDDQPIIFSYLSINFSLKDGETSRSSSRSEKERLYFFERISAFSKTLSSLVLFVASAAALAAAYAAAFSAASAAALFIAS